MGGGGYEQVVFCHDGPTGLRAIVAIHSTRLGPALGGTRFFPYRSEDDALEDVLRLARGMTYKAAVAGLDLGGGKAVIIGDPATDKTEALLRAYGRFVDSLGGRYITAEDVGTTQPDMDVIRRETTQVTGVSRYLGGSGDPSAATAYGVLHAMKAVARHLWGTTVLQDRHVVVSGVGKVGYHLARHLVEERARVTVSDVSPAALDRAATELGVEVAPVEKAHAVECDVFSPCALGGALHAGTIAELRCAAVVGCANNQLADRACVQLLEEAGVLYAPDYVVNAGGVINIAEELRGYHRQRAYANVRRIFDTTAAVLAAAQTGKITTTVAADRMAERRMDQLSRTQLIRTFPRPRRPNER
ncbi:MAG: valine dehydrogenase [Actinomycetota bacterium]|nr:valine dehydrogenase [Actinomycetota bacterium]